MASVPPVPPVPPAAGYYQPKRRSIFGPILLIVIGVAFLAVNAGFLSARTAFSLFARYWPVLLIIWGVLRLIEYLKARQEGVQPPGIGAGGVIGIIFLVLIGLSVSGAHRVSQNVNMGELRREMNIDDSEFGKWFGQKFEYADSIEQDFPANATLRVEGDRGDIKILPSSDNKLRISMRKVIYADNQAEADKIKERVAPTISTADNILKINTAERSEWQGGVLHLDIMVPRKAMADVLITRGNIEVSGRDANVKLQTQRGGIKVEDINGNAEIHLRSGSGEFTAKRVSGNVDVEGRAGDINVADIGGSVVLQGDFFGGIRFDKVAKGVRFKSSRTDLEFAKLEGSLVMEGGEMRGNNMAGPFRMDTNRGWDLHLEDLSGEVRLENRRGEVELHPKAPFGNVEVTNRQGRIRVVVPQAAGFQVDARAVRGDIESDFQLTTTNEKRDTRATGTINKGGPKLTLNNEHGVIELRRH